MSAYVLRGLLLLSVLFDVLYFFYKSVMINIDDINSKHLNPYINFCFLFLYSFASDHCELE